MAYGTKWDWRHPFNSVVLAYRAAARWGYTNPDVLYRFEDITYSVSDEYDNYCSTGPMLELYCYRVHHWTAASNAVLQAWSGTRRRVVRFDRFKQFACKTPGEALASYKARKGKQRRIYAARYAAAKLAYDLAIPPHERSI